MHSELQPSEHLKVESSIWLPLNVVSNGNASSSSQAVGVTKIAKSVIAPLAQQHVSVFMLSTYQTDFILVSPLYFRLFFFKYFFFYFFCSTLFHSILISTHKYLVKCCGTLSCSLLFHLETSGLRFQTL